MPSDNPTHCEIARELVRMGVKMPEGVTPGDTAVRYDMRPMTDEASAAMLIGLMVVPTKDIVRFAWGWNVFTSGGDYMDFDDSDYSSSPLLSGFAAFKAAKGEA
jgi:hypothetical protein